MNKKTPLSLVVTFFLVLIIIITSYFWGFKEWTKQTRADFEILNILNKLSIYIFIVFAFLKLLKHIFPNLNKCLASDSRNELLYNMISSMILTFTIPLLIFKVSIVWFIYNYSIVSFIYIFGVITICIKIFFDK